MEGRFGTITLTLDLVGPPGLEPGTAGYEPGDHLATPCPIGAGEGLRLTYD
jgi:hypothetical protein